MNLREEIEKIVAGYIQEIAEGHITSTGDWSSGDGMIRDLEKLCKQWALAMVGEDEVVSDAVKSWDEGYNYAKQEIRERITND